MVQLNFEVSSLFCFHQDFSFWFGWFKEQVFKNLNNIIRFLTFSALVFNTARILFRFSLPIQYLFLLLGAFCGRSCVNESRWAGQCLFSELSYSRLTLVVQVAESRVLVL